MSHHARAEAGFIDPPGTRARHRVGFVLRVSLALVAVAALVGFVLGLRSFRDRSGWVGVGSVGYFESRSVVHLENLGVFVVSPGWHNPFLALADKAPVRGETIVFCRSSGWFEDPMHGSKWDRYGYYRAGPAPRGMDRYRVRVVTEERVEIFVDDLDPGLPRGAVAPGGPDQPNGPFCVDGEEPVDG